MKIKHLINECSGSLVQLSKVLEAITDEVYVMRMDEVYDASVGLHVRHVIDHYDMFFAGLPDKLINYDARPREASVETQRGCALERIQSLIEQMEKMSDQDSSVQVIMELQSRPTKETRQASSIARELAFLHSHATHHYATLALMLKVCNRDIDLPEFGLAPATIRNQESLKCAP